MLKSGKLSRRDNSTICEESLNREFVRLVSRESPDTFCELCSSRLVMTAPAVLDCKCQLSNFDCACESAFLLPPSLLRLSGIQVCVKM